MPGVAKKRKPQPAWAIENQRRSQVRTKLVNAVATMFENEDFYLRTAKRSIGKCVEFAADWGVGESAACQRLGQLRDCGKALYMPKRRAWWINKKSLGLSRDQISATSWLLRASGAVSSKP